MDLPRGTVSTLMALAFGKLPLLLGPSPLSPLHLYFLFKCLKRKKRKFFIFPPPPPPPPYPTFHTPHSTPVPQWDHIKRMKVGALSVYFLSRYMIDNKSLERTEREADAQIGCFEGWAVGRRPVSKSEVLFSLSYASPRAAWRVKNGRE